MGNGIVGTNPSALAMNNPALYVGDENTLLTVAGHPDPDQNPYASSAPNYSVGSYSTNHRAWRYGGA